MPYRHAHLYVLCLFPLAGLAFWPGYLGQFAASPPEVHVHGATASLWLILLTIGVIALGAAMAYGLMRNRKRSLGERIATEAATKQEYREENRDSS